MGKAWEKMEMSISKVVGQPGFIFLQYKVKEAGLKVLFKRNNIPPFKILMS